MEDELFELCKQVYEVIGLDNDGNLNAIRSDGSIYEKDPAWLSSKNYAPLYTSDYLLEKLPKTFDDYYIDVSWSNNKYGWWAEYFTNDYTPNRPMSKYRCNANTTLKALLKLTLKLHKEGIL